MPSLPRLLVVPPRLKIPYSLIFPKHIAFFKNTGYGVLEKDKKWDYSFLCFLGHWKEILNTRFNILQKMWMRKMAYNILNILNWFYKYLHYLHNNFVIWLLICLLQAVQSPSLFGGFFFLSGLFDVVCAGTGTACAVVF